MVVGGGGWSKRERVRHLAKSTSAQPGKTGSELKTNSFVSILGESFNSMFLK